MRVDTDWCLLTRCLAHSRESICSTWSTKPKADYAYSKRSKLDHFYDLPSNFMLASCVSLVASGLDGRMCAVLAAGFGFNCCPGCCLSCMSLSSFFNRYSNRGAGLRTVPYRRYLQINGISSFYKTTRTGA